jgi:hypothetical protein
MPKLHNKVKRRKFPFASLMRRSGASRIHLSKGFFPCTRGSRLAVFGSAVFKEIGMFYCIQHIIQPRQRICLYLIERIETKLDEPSVCNVADITFYLFGRKSLYGTMLESQIDKGVFMPHYSSTYFIQLLAKPLCPNFWIFLHKGPE